MTGTMMVNAIIPVNFVRMLFTDIPPTQTVYHALCKRLQKTIKKFPRLF